MLAADWLAKGCALSELTRADVIEWLSDVSNAIAEEAERNGSKSRDYACTLLGALVGSNQAAFFQVGDGAMVVRSGSDEWSYVFWPQHGAYANTTNFVTDATASEVLEFDSSRHRVDELAVFTDGLEGLLLHFATRTPYFPFFERVFPPLRSLSTTEGSDVLTTQLAAYLSSPAICDRTDDDKTLVLASRIDSGSGGGAASEA